MTSFGKLYRSVAMSGEWLLGAVSGRRLRQISMGNGSLQARSHAIGANYNGYELE